MNEQNYNYKYIYLSGLLDLVIELFKDNLSEKMLYDKTRKILLDITNVYRDYIRNYHYSNPIKKVLWYLSDNKTEYDKLKLNIASLITDLEKNKDSKMELTDIITPENTKKVIKLEDVVDAFRVIY